MHFVIINSAYIHAFFQTAVYLLSVVCDQVNEKLEPHFINLLKLLNGILENNNKDAGDTEIYAVKAFDSLVPYLGDEYVVRNAFFK